MPASESTAKIHRVLIDTNIVSAHFKADPAVTRKLNETGAIYLPTVVLGELHYGACRSPNKERTLQRIELFLSAVIILGVDGQTSPLYGQMKAELMTNGMIIPDNDLWIAALARQHDLPVASRDAHFGHVPRLDWLKW
jgi:tRNA(fMet)-specific endonuclease VapC